MSMPIIKADEFLKRIDPEAVNSFLDVLERYPDAKWFVTYENHDLSSSGGEIFIPVGPSNTYKDLEVAKKSHPTWRHFAKDACPTSELLASKPARFVRKLPKAAPYKGELNPTDKGRRVAESMTASVKLGTARPVMVGFALQTYYGCFRTSTWTHNNDRFVEAKIAEEGAEYIRYDFWLAGNYPKKEAKLLLHYRHGLPYSAGYNGNLAEWYLGGCYEGKSNEYNPCGPNFMISEWVPMNFGHYKDELIDDFERNRRKRLEMKVLFLEPTGNKNSIGY